MACHLAGVPTAVATCGTAFGDDHARVLRRFLHDHEEFRGEVIFTFDGDAAGQKAALQGLRRRPELRLPDLRRRRARRPRPVRPADPEGRRRRPRAGGPADAALPLRAHQRRLASTTSTAPTAGSTPLREAARLVSSIRDKSKVDAFSREIAGMIGVDVERRPSGGPPRGRTGLRRPPTDGVRRRQRRRRPSRPRRRGRSCPTCATRGSRIERETLKLVIQHPAAVGQTASTTSAPTTSRHPTYRAVWEASPPPAARPPGPTTRAGHAGCATRRRPRGLVGDQRSSGSSRC